MVAVRRTHLKSGFDLKSWIESLSLPDYEKSAILQTFDYCSRHLDENTDDGIRLRKRAAEMVGILLTLHLDLPTLQTAIIYPHVEEGHFTIDQARDEFGPEIAQLLSGTRDMEAIKCLQNISNNEVPEQQVDKVRRMLISMIEDVRSVCVKLAERIAVLREVKSAPEETRVLIAKEISTIYAPLANRLGIGQLKWELEDLAFRYLHPDIYKKIAKLLDEKRIDREAYINKFVSELRAALAENGIKADVYGRPKHIYSIWRKMQKKHLEFTQLYDVRAVRIIVEKINDCYAALGVVHTHWHHIPSEFDDYIANPKPNGYKSIHTVVIGDEGKTVEIQIRTQQMHRDAELGVAAHWKYKEGRTGQSDSAYEERIAWLRKLLADSVVRAYLDGKGYADCQTARKTVVRLLGRLRDASCFPHEVGILLGYPVVDVMEFERCGGRNCKYCGCWKSYSDMEAARCSHCRFRECSCLCRKWFDEGYPLPRIIEEYKKAVEAA